MTDVRVGIRSVTVPPRALWVSPPAQAYAQTGCQPERAKEGPRDEASHDDGFSPAMNRTSQRFGTFVDATSE
jgi:hypothetical protein